MLDIVKPEIDSHLRQELVEYFRNDNSDHQAEQFENIPDFMIRDIFKSYSTAYEDMRYEVRSSQYWWYDMLQNLNNYLLKTVTQNKIGYSFIALKHAMKLLAKVMEEEPPQDGSGPSQKQQDKMNQKLKDGMNQVIQDTADEIQQLNDAEEAIGESGGANKSPKDFEMMKDRMEFMKNITLNKKSVSKFIKKSIKGFKRGFGVKHITTEEEIFDADSIEDLLDEHYLSHDLLIPDIGISDSQSQMTAFDLYIDVSGSMSSNMYLNDENGNTTVAVNRLKMAVALALKMEKMKCLGDVYKFNNFVNKLDDKEDIWKLNTSGGTDIERVMQHIVKTNRPSVILTDGEDYFTTYTPNSFIMSIVDINDYYLERDTIQKMIKDKKYIIYGSDGKLKIPAYVRRKTPA